MIDVDAARPAGARTVRPEVAAALETCFDAVLSPELWPEATEGLTRALGALASCFHMHGAPAERRMLAPISGRYRDMLDQFLAEGWAEHDLRGQRGWPLMRRGQSVVVDEEIITAEERAGAPIYAELFRRHELEVFAALGFRANDQLWVLNVARAAAMPDSGAMGADELCALQPYLTRLLSFAHGFAASAAAGAMAALEESSTAAILVDWSGRVLEMNAPAQALMGIGVTVRAGRLAAVRPDAQAQLDGLVAAAVSPDTSRAGLDRGAVALPTSVGGVLSVDALPVRAEMADAFGRTGALLILTDASARPRPAAVLLQRLYGLTPREAQVAALIASGEGVAEIGEALGLMASSVRQVVKALLWKTGARRQSELVAMMARLPDAR